MTFYKRTPNKVGGGSKTNLNGLSFEGRTSLIDSLNLHPNIEIKNNNEIHFNGVIVGYYFEKHNFYTDFIEKHKVDWKKLISKKYLPDGVFVNILIKKVFIIEKKFQESSGSVDEKLQTCDFKRKTYKKIIEKTGFETEYFYLLNSWYKRVEYEDVKEYIKSVGCNFFIDKIGLEELGIS